MKITYVCEWNNDRKNQWSGTTYSLFKALNKQVEVEECDMTLKRWKFFLLTLCNIRFKEGKIKTNNQFRRLTILYKQYTLNKLIKNKLDIPKLMIGDFGVSKNSFYYMDLSIDSLIDLRQNNKELQEYINFNNVPIKDIMKRGKYQKQILKQAECIFTMGKWLENHLIEYSGLPRDKVKAVGGGINLDVTKINPEPKKNNKILFVGRDFIRKGGDLVVDAFLILNEKYLKNAELYIIGSNPSINTTNSNIYIIGDIPSERLSEYFNKCDIFCMPSRFEAYGLVFIEALVYGLPCIGRNAYEMKEFIKDGENGYLIENDNAEILALKMYELLNNTEIKENVISRREEYIKEYSWDNVANKIINKIKEIERE